MLCRFLGTLKPRGIQLMPEQRRQADRLALVMGDAGLVSAIPAGGDNAEAVKFTLTLEGSPRCDAGGAAQGTQAIQRPPPGLVRRFDMISVGVDLHAMHRNDRVWTGVARLRDR